MDFPIQAQRQIEGNGVRPLSRCKPFRSPKEGHRHREQLSQGIDPKAARDAVSKPLHSLTFDKAAEGWVEAFKPGWRSPRSAPIRLARLKRHASPHIGARDVRDIETADVLKVLQPIWKTKSETADSVRQYLEGVFKWCTGMNYRDRTQHNPATWRGNLDLILPAKSKVHKVKHIPAMPWRDVPAFMVKLRAETALSARALELLILTATRTSDVLNAPREEISGDVWEIPPHRMKAEKEHRVPLTSQALKIIEALPVVRGNPYLIPGYRSGRPLSNMACEMLMRRMGIDQKYALPHGFRSSFRDWAAECTTVPREIAEMCLAHTVGSEVERSYRRSDLLAKRRELLQAWANFCGSEMQQSANTRQ